MKTVICLARMSELGKETRCRTVLDALDESIEVEVSFEDPFDFVEAQTLLGTRPFFSQQAAGDPGQRMCVAAIRGFQSGARKVVLIGSDRPGLTPEQIQQAFRILDDRPVVFGTAADGGYFLLGMTRVVPELFGDLPWGKPELLARSLARLTEAGIAHGLLPERND